LPCEDGTTKFLGEGNEEFDGTTRCCSQLLSQETASLHRNGRSSQSGRKIRAMHAYLSNNASDEFTSKSSLQKIGCMSRVHILHHAGQQLVIANLRERY